MPCGPALFPRVGQLTRRSLLRSGSGSPRKPQAPLGSATTTRSVASDPTTRRRTPDEPTLGQPARPLAAEPMPAALVVPLGIAAIESVPRTAPKTTDSTTT
jgi:hypothetical protein